ARQEHDQPRRLLNTHGCIIQQHGIRGAHKRRNFSFPVPFVSLAHFLQNFQQRHFLALFLMLFPAPLCCPARCCSATSTSRTPAIVASREAACATSAVRISSVTSRPSRNTRFF